MLRRKEVVLECAEVMICVSVKREGSNDFRTTDSAFKAKLPSKMRF